MKRLNCWILVILFTTLPFSGCSTTRYYKTTLTPNLQINSRTESVEATLDIYSVGTQCEAAYLGSVGLDKSPLELGVATGQPSYLVVGFASPSFWSSTSGYTNYDFTLLPRKSYRYVIDVAYIDDIYSVTVYEVNRLSGKKREMEDEELQNCRL